MNDDEWKKRAAEARAVSKDKPAHVRVLVEMALAFGRAARAIGAQATPQERRVMSHALVQPDDLAALDKLNEAMAGELVRIEVPDAVERITVALGWDRPRAVGTLSKWYAHRREQLKAEREAREAARGRVSDEHIATVEMLNGETGGGIGAMEMHDAVTAVMSLTQWDRAHAVAVLTRWYRERPGSLQEDRRRVDAVARAAVAADLDEKPSDWRKVN